MKNKILNIEQMRNKPTNIIFKYKNFKIREIKMKTRIFFSGMLTVIFLVAFSGCSIVKKTGAKMGFGVKDIIYTDSNYTDNSDEQVPDANTNYNSQGYGVGNSGNYNLENPTDNSGYINVGTSGDNSNYQTQSVPNDDPNSYSNDVNIDTFENSLSSDGNFVSVNQNEIDPENSVTGATDTYDEDIYTNIIWVPNSSYVYEGWNPYTNGRWEWSRYGWTWVSNYRWGWATYHYGRWWYSNRYGWVWSPGHRWAPAWVMWRHHKDYEGWYPISPRVHVQSNGVISHVMPHYQQNGWVFVKTNDFTKTVNNSTLVSNNKKSDIIKNSTLSISLKQDGNKFINEGPKITKNVNVQPNTIDKKSVIQVTTKQKPVNNNVITKNVSVTTQNNSKVNVNKNVNSANSNVVKETQRKVIDNKSNTTVNSSPVKKQNSTVSINRSNVTENSTTTKNNQEKINKVTTPPKNNQNNTINVTKSSNVESKTVVKDTQRKTVETPPISVEKNRNSNNNTKSYNNVVNSKTENTNKTNDKTYNTIRTDNSNKTINTVPKVNESPKVNSTTVIKSQQNNNTKRDNR